jgi:UDP-glucose 4-epimerase
MTRPVVVTGASGFIGSALVAELMQRENVVQAVSRQQTPGRSDVTSVIVTSYDETPRLENSSIIHLAEVSDSRAANQLGKQYVEDVKRQTSVLLAKNFNRFIYVSSGTVYSKGKLPPRIPTSDTSSDSIYTDAKLAAEELVREAGGVVVRLSNIYGPPAKQGTVIADILAQIPGEGPMKIRDFTPARDYLWVGDAATGLADIALSEAVGVFNLGTGIETTAGSLAKIALAVAKESNRPIIATVGNQTDTPDSIALDASDTTLTFGWKPTIFLEEGMKILFEGRHD